MTPIPKPKSRRGRKPLNLGREVAWFRCRPSAWEAFKAAACKAGVPMAGEAVELLAADPAKLERAIKVARKGKATK